MYLTRELTDLSLAEIARQFDRDHTTVLHAVRVVAARAAGDAEVADTIHRTRELLGAHEPAPLPTSSTSHQPSTHPVHNRNSAA